LVEIRKKIALIKAIHKSAYFKISYIFKLKEDSSFYTVEKLLTLKNYELGHLSYCFVNNILSVKISFSSFTQDTNCYKVN